MGKVERVSSASQHQSRDVCAGHGVADSVAAAHVHHAVDVPGILLVELSENMARHRIRQEV